MTMAARHDVVDESTEDWQTSRSAPMTGAASPRRIATRSPRRSRWSCRTGRGGCSAQLLRPHKRAARLPDVAVVIENAARLSVPFLVADGIDNGIPPIVDGEGSQHPAH